MKHCRDQSSPIGVSDYDKQSVCKTVFVAVVASYKMTGRHTYLSMSINIGLSVAVLLFLMALYKNLAPRRAQGEKETVTSATNALRLVLDPV